MLTLGLSGYLVTTFPHLRRDWAHPAHICAGTGPTPAHICAGTGPTPPTSAPEPRRSEQYVMADGLVGQCALSGQPMNVEFAWEHGL